MESRGGRRLDVGLFEAGLRPGKAGAIKSRVAMRLPGMITDWPADWKLPLGGGF